MSRRWPLLWLSVGLDLLGVLAGALLAAQLRHHNLGLVLQADGLAFGLVFLLLAWFLGGYSFLRWPWMPYRQLVQRWLLVVGSALGLAVLAGWLLNAAATAVWFHRSTLAILGVVLALWGLLQRRWLQPLARIQASQRLAASPVAVAAAHQRPGQQVSPKPQPAQREQNTMGHSPWVLQMERPLAAKAAARPRIWGQGIAGRLSPLTPGGAAAAGLPGGVATGGGLCGGGERSPAR